MINGKMMTLEQLFKKYATTRKTKVWEYCCKCKKGLWAVYAATKEQAEKEGFGYFAKYFKDGECTQ